MKINCICIHSVLIKFLTVLFLALAPGFMEAQNQNINLPSGSISIKRVFREIEKQTDMSVNYNQTRLDVSEEVNTPSRRMTLGELLNEILTSRGFEYTIEKDYIIIKQAPDNKQPGLNGPRKISGLVTDENGEPLIGANILEVGTTNGTLTDVRGEYSLNLSQSNKLQVSYIGYVTQELTVGNKNTLNIKLYENTQDLSEVVVVGYGTLTRREITGSVTNVTTKDFNQGLSKDAAGLLRGKVAGLEIINGSGDVTKNSAIRLRGVSTLQKDKGPLVVIDNIPDADMSTVAPQDIESISILKDASSAAIYGSRAAGGVILITTKKGLASHPSVNYTGVFGVATLANKPDLMTAAKWREYTSTTPGKDGTNFDRGANTDWFDEITRTGIQQDHNVSLSGGGTSHNYRGSLSYMQRDGVARDNSMKRYNMRLQFSQRALNDKLKFDLTGVGTFTNNNISNTHNFLLAYNMIPVYPVYNEDGSWFDTYEYDQGNPVRNQKENVNQNKINNYYGAAQISYTLLEGLDIKALLAKSRNNEDQSEYKSINSEAGRNDGGWAQRTGRITDRDQMEWTANYVTQINKHRINAMAGYSWEKEVYADHYAKSTSYITDDLQANGLQYGEKANNGVNSSKWEAKLISFYARGTYSYDEKYMLTATVRRDGSSKFGSDKKWGTFPSVSAGWNISQEKFMQDIKWLDNLKLSVGYGITGNQSGLDPYTTLGLYGKDGTYYDNGLWHTAYKIAQNQNKKLKWEQTAMLNIGLDFALLSDRISGRIEWYNKKTTDMLYSYQVPTPPYLHSDMMANVGDMENKGFEFVLNVSPVRTKDLDWDISLNLAHNKNKVTKLSNDEFTMDSQYIGDAWFRGGGSTSHILEVGRPIGQFYGLECKGLDENGRYIFVDQNNDGSIDDLTDYTYIGNAQPDLTYGFTNTLRYKSFDLSVFFKGSIGNDILNMPRLQYAQSGFLPGTNALDDPLTYQLTETTPRYSSFYIEDGSYLRLDNLTLGYTIKSLNRARVYFNAQNLFVITNYKGLDPEVPIDNEGSTHDGLAPGIDPREYVPKARTFSIGLSLNF